MLHFTPVQALGGSESAYSIGSQLTLAPGIFEGNAFVSSVKEALAASLQEDRQTKDRQTGDRSQHGHGLGQGQARGAHSSHHSSSRQQQQRLSQELHPRVEAAKTAVLHRLLQELERRHGCLGMVDVVLNHTSADSAWLRHHPEAGFSLRNSPHLRAAFELDEAILRLSHAIQRQEPHIVSPHMNSEGAVDAAVDALRGHPSLGLPAARLWEFYTLDVESTLAALVRTAVEQAGERLHAAGDAASDGADATSDADVDIEQRRAVSRTEGGEGHKAAAAASAYASWFERITAAEASVAPPAAVPLFTAHVPDQEVSDRARFEWAARQDALVAHVLKDSERRGAERPYVPFPLSDLAHIARHLSREAPAPAVEVVARLWREKDRQRKEAFAAAAAEAEEEERKARRLRRQHCRHRHSHHAGDSEDEGEAERDPVVDRVHTGADIDGALATAAATVHQAALTIAPVGPSGGSPSMGAAGIDGAGGDTPATDGSGDSTDEGYDDVYAVLSVSSDIAQATPLASPVSTGPRRSLVRTPRPSPSPSTQQLNMLGAQPPSSQRASQLAARVANAAAGSANSNTHVTGAGRTGIVPSIPIAAAAAAARMGPAVCPSCSRSSSALRRTGATGVQSTDAFTSVLGHVQTSVRSETGNGNGNANAESKSMRQHMRRPSRNTPFSPRCVCGLPTPRGVGRNSSLLPPTGRTSSEGPWAFAATRSESSGGIASLSTASTASVSSLAVQDGGVWNDGTGNRFSVHLDLDAALVALNSALEKSARDNQSRALLKIDPSRWGLAWTAQGLAYPGATSPADGTAASSGTSGHKRQPSDSNVTFLSMSESLYLLRHLLDAINLQFYKRYDEDMESALRAIRGTAKFLWLDQWRGARSITAHTPLVYSYFARLKQHDTDEVAVLACNGFIWNGNPEIDFTLPVSVAPLIADISRHGTTETRFVREHLQAKGTAAAGKHHHDHHSEGGHTSSQHKPVGSAASTHLAGLNGSLTALGSNGTGNSGGHHTRTDGSQSHHYSKAAASAAVPPSAATFVGRELLEYPDHCDLPSFIRAFEAGGMAAAEVWLGQAALRAAYGLAEPKPKPRRRRHSIDSSAKLAEGERCTCREDETEDAISGLKIASRCGLHFDDGYVLHLDPDVVPLPLVSASTPYMRRDIVIWGDCVKLRYGCSPSESPYIWFLNEIYVRRMARLFPALRVDNAHGTPLHVAAHMLDAARTVRPALYVNAELFTGAADRDIEYVSRLGINSLVREAMQCQSVGDLLRGIYSYGGTPLASLRPRLRGEGLLKRFRALMKKVMNTRSVFASSQKRLSLSDASAATGTGTAPGGDNDTLGTLSSYHHIDDHGIRKRTGSSVLGLVSLGSFSSNMNFDGLGIGSPSTSHAGTRYGSSADLAAVANATIAQRKRQARRAERQMLLHLNEAAVQEVLPSPIPSMFFDCTHDNVVLYEKSHPVNALPLAAIVGSTVCATGTNRGFDFLVPHNINVVADHRRYASDLNIASATHPSAGLLKVRRRLNQLRQEMAARGHTEMYATTSPAAHDSEIVTVIRGHPTFPTSYAIIARMARSRYGGGARMLGDLPVVKLEGRVVSVVMAASLYVPEQSIGVRAPEVGGAVQPRANAQPNPDHSVFDADPEFINGLYSTLSYMDEKFPGHDELSLKDASLQMASFEEIVDSSRSSGGQSTCGDASSTPGSATGNLGISIDADRDEWGNVLATKVFLDGSLFHSGSVIILKMKTPRNAVLRYMPVKHLDVPARMAAAATSSNALALSVTADAPVSESGDLALGHGQTLSGSLVGSPMSPEPTTAVFPRTASFRDRALFATQVAEELHGQHGLSRGGSFAVLDGQMLPSPSKGTLTPLRVIPPVPCKGTRGPPLSELVTALSSPRVTLLSLNKLLYCSDPEERDSSHGVRGAYVVPDLGRLPWAGAAGVQSILRHCRRWNDMGHPLFANIRAGDWLIDYTTERLAHIDELRAVRQWMVAHFDIIKSMPPGMKPQGFDRVMTALFLCGVDAAVARMHCQLFDTSFSASQHYAIEFPHPHEDMHSPVDDVTPPMPSQEQLHHNSSSSDGQLSGFASPDGEKEAEGSAAATASFVLEGHTDPAAPLPFAVALAMTSVQLFGETPSAPLLAHPLLGTGEPHGDAAPVLRRCAASLAAGFDHFATGYMRSWGRDTFISVPGLLIVTGRFAEAKDVILSYASVLRHGLMPNLMDGGMNPRYNCRDAAWWFLYAIEQYCRRAPDGTAILRSLVYRRFPSDSQEDYDATGFYRAREMGRDHVQNSLGFRTLTYRSGHRVAATADGDLLVACPLADIVSEVLQRHASGIGYREWNAGHRIDAHMKDEGFNVNAWVDPATGFVHGGNQSNCGTWMDKMGSSKQWGTDGTPATPRDGAAIEINALAYSVVSWLSRLDDSSAHGVIRSITFHNGETVPLKEWSHRFHTAFERWFWVPTTSSQDDHHCIDSRYVNKRGMYKDTVGSAAGWADYQLRPNQLVALAVAPDLFSAANACAALATVEDRLLDPHGMGVRTLDPSDWAYRPDYVNSNNSSRETANGFNYHQGPPWLWPFGFYLRARLVFPPTATGSWGSFTAARRWLLGRVARHRRHMESAAEAALPELVNADGGVCADSCAVQAWSSGTLLDALQDCQDLRQKLH
jgi:glycogen debranching enzyme